MPVVRNYEYQNMPVWSALKKYERKDIRADEIMGISEPDYPRISIMPLAGVITVVEEGRETEVPVGRQYDAQSASFRVKGVPPGWFSEKASFMLLCGTWESVFINIFHASKFDSPKNTGTPCDYYRNSGFENHYHTYDEFWILYEGDGVAYTENKAFEVNAGDCVCTGIGWHHDFPIVHNYVCAVSVETNVSGNERGHRYDHKHGKAVPHRDRI